MMRGMGNMQGMMKQVQKTKKEMVKEQEALNSKRIYRRVNKWLCEGNFYR